MKSPTTQTIYFDLEHLFFLQPEEKGTQSAQIYCPLPHKLTHNVTFWATILFFLRIIVQEHNTYKHNTQESHPSINIIWLQLANKSGP